MVDGRSGEDLGVSVMEIPEFPDGQLFEGTTLWPRRWPEARYGPGGNSNLLSGLYGGRWASEGIHSLYVVEMWVGERWSDAM